ncbi:MAG: TolC family protein [Nitrospirae bacterium]|nr:TolC family protein [Nitrospirota bacterium]
MQMLALGFLLITLAADATATLTWEDCLRETAANNPELAAARERLDSLRDRELAARSPFLPQLSADAGLSRRNASSAGAGSGTTNDLSLGLSARQNLFAGWEDRAALERSRVEYALAEAERDDTSSRLRLELATAFARLRYAQDALRLAESVLLRRRENVRLVELRFEAGRENKGSLLRSRAAESQARLDVSQGARDLHVRQRELARILARGEAAPLIVSGDPPPLAEIAEPDVRAIADQVPSTRRARASLQAAGTALESARSQLYPNLDAFGSVSRGGDPWPPDSNRWSAGLSVSYPFFPGGRTAYDIGSARAEQRRAEALVRDARERAAVDIEEALAGRRNAVERSEVQREFLEAARLRAEIARSQYTSGLLSFQDWDLIENDLISSEKGWLVARTDVRLAEAAWLKALGKGIGE